MPFIPRTTREAATQDAAEVAGKFLDGLGKTDLQTLTFDEWMEFISQIVVEYDRSYEARDETQEDATKANIGNWSNTKPVQTSFLNGPLQPTWNSPNWSDPDEIPF